MNESLPLEMDFSEWYFLDRSSSGAGTSPRRREESGELIHRSFSSLSFALPGIEAKNAARTARDFADFPECTLYIPVVKFAEKRILV